MAYEIPRYDGKEVNEEPALQVMDANLAQAHFPLETAKRVHGDHDKKLKDQIHQEDNVNEQAGHKQQVQPDVQEPYLERSHNGHPSQSQTHHTLPARGVPSTLWVDDIGWLVEVRPVAIPLEAEGDRRLLNTWVVLGTARMRNYQKCISLYQPPAWDCMGAAWPA